MCYTRKCLVKTKTRSSQPPPQLQSIHLIAKSKRANNFFVKGGPIMNCTAITFHFKSWCNFIQLYLQWRRGDLSFSSPPPMVQKQKQPNIIKLSCFLNRVCVFKANAKCQGVFELVQSNCFLCNDMSTCMCFVSYLQNKCWNLCRNVYYLSYFSLV